MEVALRYQLLEHCLHCFHVLHGLHCQTVLHCLNISKYIVGKVGTLLEWDDGLRSKM